jgi:hypothetical protein
MTDSVKIYKNLEKKKQGNVNKDERKIVHKTETQQSKDRIYKPWKKKMEGKRQAKEYTKEKNDIFTM